MTETRRTRRFKNSADELNTLNDRLTAAMASGDDRTALLTRMREVLDAAGPDDGSIMWHDHWAVWHEATGDPAAACAFREREIALVERLFDIGGPVGPIDERFRTRLVRRLIEDYTLCHRHDDARRWVERLPEAA